jgi:hypothetical protein
LASAIFSAIRSAGLTMAEFDINNELNVAEFTVQARLFFDNKHAENGSDGTTDVLTRLRSLASAHSLNPNVITASTFGYSSSVSGFHCGSVYGDSAMVLGASSLLGMLAGGWSHFGWPHNPAVTNWLTCGGTTEYMIQLPVRYQTYPSITDLHMVPCVVNSSRECTTADATVTARTFYSDLWTLLSSRGLTANVAMIGETSSNQNCEGQIPAMAAQNVAGYNTSTLRTNHSAKTTMRPWENQTHSCYGFPAIINPPYTP